MHILRQRMAIVPLAIALGISAIACDRNESVARSGNATANAATIASAPAAITPVPDTNALPPAAPQPKPFQAAIDTASGAFSIGQSATSSEDWHLVASRWQSAIHQLQTVPQSSPNYARAQIKISEYQRNFRVAQKNTKPLQMVSTSQIQSLQSPYLVSFFQWCSQQDSLPSSAKHTVRVLLKEAGTQNCYWADKKLEHRTSLNLSSKQISHLGPVSSLRNLQSLLLNDNQIADLRPLSPLTNLTWLELGHNRIVDIRPLSPLTNLSWLDLQANRISDVRPLSSLVHLTWLDLNNNRIADARPLSFLYRLTSLGLANNSVGRSRCPLTPTSLCKF